MAKNSRKQAWPQKDLSEPEAAQRDLSEPGAAQEDLSEPDAAQVDIFETEADRDGNPLAAAFQKLREGRSREATDLYHDIVEPTETPLVAHINRGIRHDEHGRHELAIEEFLAAENVDRENVENLAHLATAYGALGRFGEADVVIDRAIRLDPVNVQV